MKADLDKLAHSGNNINSDLHTFHKLVGGNPVYDDELVTAPWLIGINDFASYDDRTVIEFTLEEIKKEHVMLVLASPAGKRYGNTILTNIDDESLGIDRPNGFTEDTTGAFRVYFQDIANVWSFFEVDVIDDCSHNLCSTYPEVLYRLQQRSRYRVDVPGNTRAVFWQGDVIHHGGHVCNISSAGMLLCTENRDEKFAEDTIIHDIAIALPLHKISTESDNAVDKAVLPVITRGRIVRSFREQGTGFVCHGISFSDGDDVISEIDKYVKESRTEKGAAE